VPSSFGHTPDTARSVFLDQLLISHRSGLETAPTPETATHVDASIAPLSYRSGLSSPIPVQSVRRERPPEPGPVPRLRFSDVPASHRSTPVEEMTKEVKLYRALERKKQELTAARGEISTLGKRIESLETTVSQQRLSLASRSSGDTSALEKQIFDRDEQLKHLREDVAGLRAQLGLQRLEMSKLQKTDEEPSSRALIGTEDRRVAENESLIEERRLCCAPFCL